MLTVEIHLRSSSLLKSHTNVHPRPMLLCSILHPLSNPQVRELSVLYVKPVNSSDFARQVLHNVALNECSNVQRRIVTVA